MTQLNDRVALVTGGGREIVCGIDQCAAFDAHLAVSYPLGREQTPEDIGNAVVFLAWDLARNITGQAFNVDDGIAMN